MQEGPFNVLRHKEWDRAPKEPVSLVGLAATFLTGGATSGIAFYAAYAAVSIGISAVTSWALSALAPKPDMSGGVGRGLKTNIRDAASPHDFVYGKTRKGGTITYLEGEPSNTNKFLSMIIVLAGHKVNSIGDIYINDELATINGSDYVTNDRWSVSSDSLPHKIQIFKYDGTQTTPSGPLQTNSEQVDTDTNFIGNDISYLYVRLNYASEVFTGGIPTFTAVVEGKKVYDPRTATTAYSANAALCIRDYLISEYGLDEDTINIDDTSFSVAANTCDEDVDLVDYWGSGTTPTEKRYEINGVLSAANTPNVNLQKMMTACAGTLFWGGGKWKLKVGEYIAPTLSLTLDDVRGPLNISTKTSRRDNFNIVRGTFVNYDPLYEVDGSPAPINWLVQDYPEIESATFITEDNEVKIPLDLELPLTTSSSMAQRLAKMTLLRAREQITLSVDFSVAAFEAQVGEVIEFTAERYGWVNKEFEIVGWKFFISEDGDLRVNLSLRETSEAAFAWDADERQIIANNTNLPDYRVGVTVANLTAVNNGGRVSSDGTWWPRVRLSWDSSASGFVDSYDIRYKVNGEADTLFRYTSATQNSVTINDLSDGQTYYFEVRARTGSGYVGAWASTTLFIAKDTTAPAIPSGLTVTGQISAIELNWNSVSDSDLSHYLIYRNNTNNSGTSALIGQTASTRFTDYVGPDLSTRYYWLKAVDFSGNTSGFSSVASGTSNYITQLDVAIDDLLDGAVNVASFATGLTPVEVLGALPSTGNFEGRQVYLTTDNKLYRHTGSPTNASGFTVETDGADIKATSITAGKIEAGAIGADQIAANEISAKHLAVTDFSNLVPDGVFNQETSIDNWSVVSGNGTLSFIPALKMGKYALYFSKTTAAFTSASLLPYIPVKSSTEYFGQTEFRLAAGQTAADGVFVRVFYYDVNNAACSPIYRDIASNAPGSATIDTRSISFTTPSNCVSIRIRVYNHCDEAGDIDLIIDNIIVREKNAASLIVDGSITANFIGTNQIVTSSANIADAVITSAKIGNAQITTAKIDDLQVTTLKIGDNAVTSTAYDYDNSGLFLAAAANPGSRVYTNYNNVAITKTTSNPVLVELAFSAGGSGTSRDYRVLRNINGGSYSTIRTIVNTVSATNTTETYFVLDTSTGTGTYRYLIQFRDTETGSFIINECLLSAQEVKK